MYRNKIYKNNLNITGNNKNILKIMKTNNENIMKIR